MTVVKVSGVAFLLLCASTAQAGGVYRCKGAHGGVYYSDKGCDTGDKYAKATDKGNMSVLGTGKFKPAQPSYKLGAAAPPGGKPVYQTQNRYTQRAEAGAARAGQALAGK